MVVLIALSACSAAGGSDRGSTPRSRPDEALRDTIRASLTQRGHHTEAGIVDRGGSRLTRIQTPFLNNWRIIQVDYRQGAHPVLFHVAVGGGQARLLTGTPTGFSEVTAADGVRITDPAVAAGLARTYVETTRPPGKLTYVVAAVRQIRFRPGLTGSDATLRDQIIQRYGNVVTSPAATPRAKGFTAVVYVVQDRALQRRDITVGANGSVTEKTKTLVPNLPVPYVL